MRKNYQGTAIFMALLIVAIVSSLAIFLMRTQQIDIRRTQMMLTSEEAYLYAQGVTDWAITTLQTEIMNPKATTSWPLVLPPTPIANGQGKIAGTLFDAEGLFNLNNLAETGRIGSIADKRSKAFNENTKLFLNLLAFVGFQLSEN